MAAATEFAPGYREATMEEREVLNVRQLCWVVRDFDGKTYSCPNPRVEGSGRCDYHLRIGGHGVRPASADELAEIENRNPQFKAKEPIMSSNAPVSAPDLSKEAQVGKTKKAKPVAVKKAKPVKKAKAEKKPRAKKSGVEKVDLKEAVKLRKTGMGFWDDTESK